MEGAAKWKFCGRPESLQKLKMFARRCGMSSLPTLENLRRQDVRDVENKTGILYNDIVEQLKGCGAAW
ncbi:UNVERIFIED_CONTAM: hypothetical protein Slati_3446100 [Sesamum latifolium]|uniref:Uncharacterized protein n=1 Tax=Sesamum latifolium TaxID=2727402 RepID=A0AAW2UGQ5_9LAMI